jgi:DNA primase catalytic core
MKKKIIPKEKIQEVHQESDIKKLIEEDTGQELTHESGDEYHGYHSNKHGSESETSLKVNAEKGLYHCFNCGEGGNSINWVMLNRGMEFMEAVRYLAARYDVEIEDLTDEEKAELQKHFKIKKKLSEIYEETANWYNSKLTDELYQIIEEMWGIDREIVNELKIGFAPADKAALKTHLIKKGFKWSFLKKTGLFVARQDFFQGRIVFPYFKNYKPVFFIARKTKYTPDNKYEHGKYKKLRTHSKKNSHIFEEVQNNTFYGEDTVGKSNKLIITEGITDAITTIAKGFSCISPVTVQFREKDYSKLNEFAEKANVIYIVNDNEESGAGEQGAWKTAEFLNGKGHNVRIVKLPRPDDVPKTDLAEYFKEHDKEDFEKLLEEAKTPLEIAIDRVANSFDRDEKIKLVKEIVSPLFLNLEPIKREIYERKLKDSFEDVGKIRISTIRKMINKNLNELREEKQQKQNNENNHENRSRIKTLKETKHGYCYETIEYEDGEEVIKRTPLSNFTLDMKMIFKNQLEGTEILSGEIRYFDGKKEEIDIDYAAFVTSAEFKKALKGRAIWLGNNNHVQQLKGNIDKNGPVQKKLFNTAGRHTKKILMPGITINKEGPIEDAENVVKNLNDNQFLSNMPSEWPSKENHIKAAEAVYKYLAKINEPAIAGSLIGWNFALPWCDLIRSQRSWGGFPHLITYGEAGSGKTQTAKLVWRLNGVNSNHEPFSLPNTRFTRLNNYSSTNLIPLVMDEYRPEAWAGYHSRQIHEELRNIYNKNSAERGRANLTTKVYSLSAPIILCGEDRPRDTTGLEERMIILNPNKDIVDGNTVYGDICKKSFKELQKAPLESFALPYYSWCLRHENWLEELNECRKQIIELGDSEGLNFPERIINNLAILEFGWNKFHQYAEALGIEIKDTLLDETNYEEVLKKVFFNVMPGGQHFNELDQLMIFVSVMTNNSVIQKRIQYSIKNGNRLILRLQDVLPKAGEYANRTNRNKELLGKDAYRSIIRRLEKNKDSYVISSSGKGTFREGQELRGVVIDLDKLEEKLGIEKEVWM